MKQGFKHSEESKKNISDSRKGMKFSEEHIKNLSKSHIGKKGYPTWKNKHFSKEHIKNLSISKKKFYSKGNHPWNYIDGRSKNCSPKRYGDDWSLIRLLIYERDNWTCQKCGLKMDYKTGAHDVHHKIPFLKSFDNSLKNLITLCRSCHIKEEAKIIKTLKGGKVNNAITSK